MRLLLARSAVIASAVSAVLSLHATPAGAQASPASSAATPSKPKPKTKAPKGTSGAAATAPGTAAAAGAPVVVTPVSPAPVPVAAPAPPPTPPAPPAWTEAPTGTSFSGSQLVPVGASLEGATVTAATAGTSASSSEDLERRVDALETRLDAANKLLKEYEADLHWLHMLKISGYLQPQLLWQFYNAAASPNASGGMLPNGIGANDVIANPTTSSTPTTNPDYFRLRRARLKVEFMPVDSARFVFEIDPTAAGGTVGGTGTVARQIEAQGIAHWTDHITTEFAMGIFKIPFGWEVLQSDADRPFIERSWGERNMTPGEFDTGIRAYTTFFDGKLTFQAAVINGNMEGEKTFTILPDLNKGKDLVGRINYNFGPFDAGLSGYYGQGQLVDQTGLRFKQYPRGAGNVELALHHTFAKVLGETRVFAEGTIAANMDRGVNYSFGLPAFPTGNIATTNVTSLNEMSAWGRAEQDFTRWFTLGFRFDYYTPDLSTSNDGRATLGVVGAVHFTRWLQDMVEYDHAIDNARAPGGAAPGKHIDTISEVLQVRF